MPLSRLSALDEYLVGRIAAGETNKEIAAGLGLAESTVKWHVTQLLRRFEVPNRAALVAVANDNRGRSEANWRER